MELDGQRVRIINGCDEMITDLCFLLPGTDIVSKVKKCKPGAHVDEHIFGKYKGDLTFFFKNDPDIVFTFENAVTMPKDTGLLGYDVDHSYALQFRIIRKDGHYTIQQESYTTE